MALVLTFLGALFPWLWAGPVWAHIPTDDTSIPDWRWRADVILVVVILGTTYIRGWVKLRSLRSTVVHWWQLALYLAALAAICLALISPIDTRASALFSMHMVQHLVLLMIAPLFILLANPLAAFLWGLPKRARRRAGRFLIRNSLFRRALRALTLMPASLSLYVTNLWTWHHPVLYQMALRNEWIHDFEHMLFFTTALLFWWPIVNPAPHLHGVISYGFRIVYLIAATLQNTLLGMAIALPERVLYPFYATAPRLRDLSPIDDQSLGGGIMWVSGHMYLIPILVLVARMMMSEEENLRSRPSQSFPGRVQK